MPEVRSITSLDALEALRLPWNALWMNSARHELAHSFDWFWDHWPRFGRGRQLQVLAVSSHRRTIGILPLAIRTDRLWRTRTVEFALHDQTQAVRVVGADIAATYAAAMSYLASEYCKWHRLAFGPFSDPGEMARCRTAIEFSGLRPQRSNTDSAWIHARR